MKRRWKANIELQPFIFTIIAVIVMVIICLTNTGYQDWIKTDADVIAWRNAYGTGGSVLDKQVKELKYQYEVDGLSYTGTTKTAYKQDNVSVLINPTDPSISKAEGEITVWKIMEVCFFVILGLMLILNVFITWTDRYDEIDDKVMEALTELNKEAKKSHKKKHKKK